MKPDITFFGETLPDPFFKAIKQDVSKCDLVIVIGTSLKVGGSVHLLLKHVEDEVPQVSEAPLPRHNYFLLSRFLLNQFNLNVLLWAQVLINREAVVPPANISGGFDVSLLGEVCVDVCLF